MRRSGKDKFNWLGVAGDVPEGSASFILHPSSFIISLHGPGSAGILPAPSGILPDGFRSKQINKPRPLHPSSFILHPSSFILHPSSFIKKGGS
jgi:hypothetical protein